MPASTRLPIWPGMAAVTGAKNARFSQIEFTDLSQLGKDGTRHGQVHSASSFNNGLFAVSSQASKTCVTRVASLCTYPTLV
jgi:hypothetical protein